MSMKFSIAIGSPINRIIEKQVDLGPDKIAVIQDNKFITYDELNKKANQLAHYLVKAGVETEDVVGVLSDKSIQTIINILAILKAGGAYLPIDISFPEDRIIYMLEKANAKFLITNNDAIVTTAFFCPILNENFCPLTAVNNAE